MASRRTGTQWISDAGNPRATRCASLRYRRRGPTIAAAVATAESLGARFISPHQLPEVLDDVECAVLSPGVPPISAVVRTLNVDNVPVIGEIELAYRLCRAPIIAVTGTKGKSTTTALIGHILRSCGRGVRVGGNIGNPLIREVVSAGADDWVVAEVSSFQLETIRSFRPRVAVLLNVEPDHLDRYPSMDEYAEAKYRIVANQAFDDWFVGNLDDPRIAALAWQRGSARWGDNCGYAAPGEHAAMYLRNETVTYAPAVGDPRPLPLLPVTIFRCPGSITSPTPWRRAGRARGRLRPGHGGLRGGDVLRMPHRLKPAAKSTACSTSTILRRPRRRQRSRRCELPAADRIDCRRTCKRQRVRRTRPRNSAQAKALVTIGEAANDIAQALGPQTTFAQRRWKKRSPAPAFWRKPATSCCSLRLARPLTCLRLPKNAVNCSPQR